MNNIDNNYNDTEEKENEEKNIYYSKKQLDELIDDEKEHITKRIDSWMEEDFGFECKLLGQFLREKITNLIDNRKKTFFRKNPNGIAQDIHRRTFELCEVMIENQRKKQKRDEQLMQKIENIEKLCCDNKNKIISNEKKEHSVPLNCGKENANNSQVNTTESRSTTIKQWNFKRFCKSCEREMELRVWEKDDQDDYGEMRPEWLYRLYWMCMYGCKKITGFPIRFFFDEYKNPRPESYYRNFVIPRTQEPDIVSKINIWLNSCKYLPLDK